MNFNRNYDPRQVKRRKELIEHLGRTCPSCKADHSARVVGELEEEITLCCSSCGHFWEIEHLQE